MGKLDEIRKLREAQSAKLGRDPRGPADDDDHHAPPAEAPAIVEATSAPHTTTTLGRSARVAIDVQGKCAACGKVRAVQGGVLVQHQKGLGKVCAGSRKPPLP